LIALEILNTFVKTLVNNVVVVGQLSMCCA
jgi:hypothetical protein